MTVLIHEWVTGGGLADEPLPASWAAEGGAMRRAIAADFASLPGVRVVVTLDPRLPPEPGPWTAVRIGPGEEEPRLLGLAVEANYTVLIAPETGGVLADRTRALEEAGVALLGSGSEAVDLAGDKLKLAKHLAEWGIRTPPGCRVVPAEGLPDDFTYPAVLKPIDGAGSVDTFLIERSGDVPGRAAALSEALLQPFLPGLPMSASLLVDHRGRPTLIGIGRQSVVVRDGRFEYRGGTLPAPQENFDATACRAVEAVPGLRGFVGVDFVWDDATGDATILEINPRPTTSVVGLARLLPAGRLARAWIDLVQGDPGPASTDLAALVHRQSPLTFLADGTIRRDG